jgi:hypothetical protein
VSEYQYYEFLALDQPLTAKQRAELRSISTRAEITATRLLNEYQWGDLKGDPQKLMEQYFDASIPGVARPTPAQAQLAGPFRPGGPAQLTSCIA